MPNEDTQPQSGETAQDGGRDGAASPQPEPEAAAVEQPGAEAGRTYTQQEWSQRESAKDKETAEVRKQLATLVQQTQFYRAQAEEATYQAQERQAVERGELTQEEASQRVSLRQQAQQQLQKLAYGEALFNAMSAEGEKIARIRAAHDFGKEFGVDPDELVRDTSLTGPEQMRLKAREMQLQKREAALNPQAESFDMGQVGSTGVSIDKMTPEEKIRWALAHPGRTKR